MTLIDYLYSSDSIFGSRNFNDYWREDSEGGYIGEYNLPGIKREDLSLKLNGRLLLFTWVRRGKEGRMTLRLPREASRKDIKAKLEDGVLTVRVQTLSPEEDSSIEIE